MDGGRRQPWSSQWPVSGPGGRTSRAAEGRGGTQAAGARFRMYVHGNDKRVVHKHIFLIRFDSS